MGLPEDWREDYSNRVLCCTACNTFGTLIYIVKAAPEEFRTGWFVESLLTELLITLVLRTRRSIFKSKPGFYLWLSTLAVTVVARCWVSRRCHPSPYYFCS